MNTPKPLESWNRLLATASLFVAAAAPISCDPAAPSPMAPDRVSDVTPFSSGVSDAITLTELDELLSTGAQRLEIELTSATAPFVAREVEVEGVDDLHDEEAIESRAAAVSVSGGAGTVTLELGGLVVEFGSGAKLRGPEGQSISAEELADILAAGLAAGRAHPVEVRRAAPADPHEPGDGSFVATEIRLDRDADEPKIEINVDSDNLTMGQPLTGVAVLRVLGLDIGIEPGTTEIETDENEGGEDADEDDSTDDADDGDEDDSSDDADDDHASDDYYDDADDDGDDDDADDDDPEDVDFEGRVTAVDVAGRSFTLADGTKVLVTSSTEIEDKDYRSLEAVAAALAAGVSVEADGEGIVTDEGPPRVIEAIEVEFEKDD